MKLIDLTGKRFHRLTVLRRCGTYISPKGAKSVTWECLCDCGNVVIVHGASLKSGTTKSCGCLRKKVNDFYITGDVAHILCGLKEILIDVDDFEMIMRDSWHIGKNGYACRNADNKLMHRIITSAPKGEIIDHINRNRLDNRKSNLRFANPSINGFNKHVKVGMSGEHYISLNKSNNYYCVYVDGKYEGGSYDIEIAKAIRNESLMKSKAIIYSENAQKCIKDKDEV